MTNAEMNKKVEELRQTVSDKEKRMLEFMSEAEQQAYFETKARMQDYETKLKKKRDAAVRKQKAEYDFWKQVRERKDEVLQFLAEPTAGAESSEVEDDIPDIEDDETQETVSMANSQYQNGYGNR